jgi:two-component system sensor histidine kinase UhpB
VASLEWQARAFEQRMGILCTFRASSEEIAVDGDQAIALFRVCQEALNNIAKHAGASRVDIRLDAYGDSLLLEIADDGKGIAGDDIGKRSCFGLLSMKERAHSLGGTIDIASPSGRGTTISVTAPLHRGLEPHHDRSAMEVQAR